MSGFKVNFSVNNQLATPSIHAAPLAQRPAFGQPGRVFIDTDAPSTGIYRDTGSAWIQIASTSSPEADTLQTVTDRGNTTTNDIAIGTSSNPSAPLDVHGQDTIAILQATGTNNGFLQFNKSGSGKFKLGNVHNAGNDYFTVYNLQENSDAILVNISTNNVAIGGGTVTPTYKLDITGSLRNTGNAYLATNESFVGIGTTSPATSLQISRVASASLPVSLRLTNTAGSTNLTNNAGNTNLDAGGAAWTMTFSKVSSEIMRISGSNNLLLNTTTDAGYKLQVSGTTQTTALRVSNGNIICDNSFIGNAFVLGGTTQLYFYNNTNGGLISANQGPITAYFTIPQTNTQTTFVVNDAGGAPSGYKMQKWQTGSVEKAYLEKDGNLAVLTSGYFGSIGTVNSNAVLQADSTTRGFLPPRMTTAQKNAIANTAGLVVFDTTLSKLCVNSGAGWETITSV